MSYFNSLFHYIESKLRQPKEVVIDRPFLFAIRNTKYNITLVVGRVVNPGIKATLSKEAEALTRKPDQRLLHQKAMALNEDGILDLLFGAKVNNNPFESYAKTEKEKTHFPPTQKDLLNLLKPQKTNERPSALKEQKKNLGRIYGKESEVNNQGITYMLFAV